MAEKLTTRLQQGNAASHGCYKLLVGDKNVALTRGVIAKFFWELRLLVGQELGEGKEWN